MKHIKLRNKDFGMLLRHSLSTFCKIRRNFAAQISTNLLSTIMMKLTSKTILFGALAGAALLLSLQAQADNVTLTTSDLPIVIINTDAEINADAKIPGTMQIIDNGSGQTNSVSDTPNGFDGHIGIKLRGESSLNFNQKKYTIAHRFHSLQVSNLQRCSCFERKSQRPLHYKP